MKNDSDSRGPSNQHKKITAAADESDRSTAGMTSPERHAMTAGAVSEPVGATLIAGARRAAHSDDHPLGAGSSPVSMDDVVTALEVERSSDDRLSVYVHLPFCPSRCLTCDHQTSVTHDTRHIDHYLDGLEREISLVTEHLGRGQPLQQLHLGGGTPNYLTDLQLVRLMNIIEAHFTLDEHTEASLEANAHRASLSQLSLLHGLGFRALNLELRDLDSGVQEAIGRRQSLPVVRDVVESARGVGFTRVSTDLVYGLPRQTADSITATVDELVRLAPDRISCYSFSRRSDRFSHQCAVERRLLPSLGDKVSIFSRIVDGLEGGGYQWVGLDCFARPEDSITRAHKAGKLHRNWIGYTDKSGRSLLGLGSSATSDLSTICVRNQVSVERWRDALENGQLPVRSGIPLSPERRERRRALSDLMCNLQHASPAQFGVDQENGNDSAILNELIRDGYVEMQSDRVAVTEIGRYALHQLWGDASPGYRWTNLL